MKSFSFIIVSLLMLASSCQKDEPGSDIVDVPDDIFLEWLINEGVDKNNDGLISRAEAEAISTLRISPNGDDESPLHNVVELTGIKAFKNLDTLTVSWIPIHTLDISKLNKLLLFDIKWTYVNDLNISGCTGLKYLGISQIGNDRLDISDCSSLEDFTLRNVGSMTLCVWTLPFPPVGADWFIDEEVTITTNCSN